MKAAVYCRKSNAETNGNGGAAPDDTKSVVRQLEHARAFAAERGWSVSDEHVYSDDAVSGADFKRPGLMRLLNALGKRAPFDVLVVSELSRLGREQLETGYVMKQLATAGVAVWSYLERKEILMSSPTDKFLMSAVSFAAEVEREKARERSRDAARQRAARGAVAGGVCFGYRNVRDASGFVVREIDTSEAATVRRIFRLCAAGKGTRRIAQALNAEGAPAPRAQRGRPNGWVPSSVRAVLFRSVYRGEVVWGKQQKRDGWGHVAPKRRPESEWLTVAAPHLRIVSDSEWEAAHERLATSRLNYLRATDGQLWGKPASGIESRYLLVGQALCGACGGGLQVFSRSHGKRRAYFYGCPRGRLGVCANNLDVAMELADRAVIEMLTEGVLSAEVVRRAIEKLVAMLDGPQEDADARRTQLTATAAKAEQEAARLSAAIAVGGEMEALMSALRDRERTHKAALAELRALDAGPALRAATADVIAEAERLAADWRGVLGRTATTARQVVRKLLAGNGRVVLYPMATADGERYYEAGLVPSLDRFLAAVPSLKKAVASPTGFEPVFWP